jgi:hypothetical protein
MPKKGTKQKTQANLSGFYHFLKHQYRFPEARLRGIIACTGMILNKVHDLSMSRADLERVNAYMRGIGLTGDALHFFVTSFIFYILYMESVKGNSMKA